MGFMNWFRRASYLAIDVLLATVALTFTLRNGLVCAGTPDTQTSQLGNELPESAATQNEYPAHVEVQIGRSSQAGASRKEPTQILGESKGSIAVITAVGQTIPKMGTGFFVASTGLLLTNFHVIEGSELVHVKLPGNGAVYSADKVKGYDSKIDLAILEVETGAVRPLRIGNSDEAYVGEPITVISNPLGLEQTVSNGLLSGIRDLGGRKLFQISAPLSMGSSGAPVFNERGEVIAVATSIIPFGQSLNFATPINYAKALLESSEEILLSSLPKRTNPFESLSPPKAESNPGKTADHDHFAGPNIDVPALMRETLRTAQTKDGATTVLWVPREAWQTLAQHDPTNSPAIEVVTKALSKYTLVGVAEAKSGALGYSNYTEETALASEVKLKDTNGVVYAPLAQNEMDSAVQLILALWKPVAAKTVGVPQHVHFLVFPAFDKSGHDISDATKEGKLCLQVGEKVFHWRLPLGSLLPSKTCPVCKEQLSGAYKYCPYDGTKLP